MSQKNRERESDLQKIEEVLVCKLGTLNSIPELMQKWKERMNKENKKVLL